MATFLKALRHTLKPLGEPSDFPMIVAESRPFFDLMESQLPVASRAEKELMLKVAVAPVQDSIRAINDYSASSTALDLFGDGFCAGDGKHWRGCCGELIYRLGADLTMTIPCGEHAYFQRFARVVFFFHCLCFNFFFTVSLIVILDKYEGSDYINQGKAVAPYLIGAGTGILFFAYLRILHFFLLANTILTANSRENNKLGGCAKRCCGFMERIGHYAFLIR
jgi:hypothetical protein